MSASRQNLVRQDRSQLGPRWERSDGNSSSRRCDDRYAEIDRRDAGQPPGLLTLLPEEGEGEVDALELTQQRDDLAVGALILPDTQGVSSTSSSKRIPALDRRGAELLFQVLAEREETNSVAIASKESFGKAHMFPRTCAR